MQLNRAETPFLFKTQLSLVLLTGLKAGNALQLRDHLRAVPEASIYYHTHNFLQQHHFLIPEPPNDFAYWLTNILKEDRLGEKLAAIDTVRFTSLDDLRRALISAMDTFLDGKPVLREAPIGSKFHFMKVILFNLPTDYQAHDLLEFTACLKKVTVSSLYYHMFEGRLRTSHGVNDFSSWLNAMGETSLAKQIDQLDPYTHTMEELRLRIVHLAEKRIGEKSYAAVG